MAKEQLHFCWSLSVCHTPLPFEWLKAYIYIYLFIYTVGTESIQTPLNFSLFVILQPFAKII